MIDVGDIKWHKHFDSRKNFENRRMQEQWNFAGIQKPIKKLFPDLTDESIKTYSNLVHGKR